MKNLRAICACFALVGMIACRGVETVPVNTTPSAPPSVTVTQPAMLTVVSPPVSPSAVQDFTGMYQLTYTARGIPDAPGADDIPFPGGTARLMVTPADSTNRYWFIIKYVASTDSIRVTSTGADFVMQPRAYRQSRYTLTTTGSGTFGPDRITFKTARAIHDTISIGTYGYTIFNTYLGIR